MTDPQIIELYFARDQQAVSETAAKYGAFLLRLSRNILRSPDDAEECVNDTYLSAWNAMPPHWPERLPSFLGRITRNLSFNRYQSARADKRGGGETALVLEELAGCVSGSDSPEEALDRRELVRALNAFVRGLPEDRRDLFVRRYWYADPVSDIARDWGLPPGTVSKRLERTRRQLRDYLTERGFTV